MKLEDIVSNSRLFTDEQTSDDTLLQFSNSAISRINAECNTTFSNYEDMDTTYTDFPASWQLGLVGNYVSYAIKMNDGSLNEADRYLQEFYKILELFSDKLIEMTDRYESGDDTNGINPDFISTIGLGGVYGIDTSQAVDRSFFSNDRGAF